MIEAVGTLIKDGKDISFTIVGDAVTDADRSYSDTVKRMVKEQGLVETVKFVGSVAPHEIVSYLQDADLFVNMSNTGSVDKAVLEALACGVPAISSNTAFKNILDPHNLFIHEQTAASCAETMRSIIGCDLENVASSLRDYVISTHSLYNLIPLLINHMHHEASR
jgi:glycosyltransferase involved in cell wall biosynthesis